MQTQNRLLDDLARVASGAIGVASGMREEAEAQLRAQFERVLSRFDLVVLPGPGAGRAVRQRLSQISEKPVRRDA